MSKKDKLGLDKVVGRFNKEFEKTSSQFNKLVSDAFKQLESLQSQIHEPIKKIMEDLDKLRDREMNRFQAEFDKRLSEFHDLQSQLLEKIGLEQPKPAPKKTPKPAATKKPVAKKPVAKKTAAKPAKTATKAASPKPAAKKVSTKKTAAKPSTKTPAAKPATTSKAKPSAKAKIADLNGVGPATVKKLAEAGIKELSQIASPSAQDKKSLDAFSKTKGFDTWQSQASKLIG